MSGMLKSVLIVVVALIAYDILVKPFTSKISLF